MSLPRGDESDPRLISGGYWEDNESYPRDEWQAEVAAGDTQRGYWDWVNAQTEQEADKNAQMEEEAKKEGIAHEKVA